MNKVIYNGEIDNVSFKDCIAQTLEIILETDSRACYLDADLMASLGTINLVEKFHHRAIDCGIQEANMIGIASGLSSEGMKPYCHTFGVFASRRCYDQVFMSVAYANTSVRILGSDPGVQALYNGGTHQPYEDVALYRVIPNSAIYEPCDNVQLRWALESTKERHGVTYLRVARKNQPKIYENDTLFEEGKGIVVKNGVDVTILCVGMMVAESLEAAKLLDKDGISARIIDLVTIKPLDESLIVLAAKETGVIVTAENSFVKGGVFGAVSELLAAKHPTIIEHIGLDERFGEVGDLEYLKKAMHLTACDIADKAKIAISRKNCK